MNHPTAGERETRFMKIVRLGNGLVKMRAVRLDSGKWGVAFTPPDGRGEVGDQQQAYVPGEDDVIVEITNLESAAFLQGVLYRAINAAAAEIHARS